MRKLSKPSTAWCNWNFYTLFLLAELKYMSCVRLGAILEELRPFSQKVFLLELKVFLLELWMLLTLSWEPFKHVHDGHWRIESFHRVIKQVCNIERFHVRNGEAIRNHIFCALRAFRNEDLIRSTFNPRCESFKSSRWVEDTAGHVPTDPGFRGGRGMACRAPNPTE